MELIKLINVMSNKNRTVFSVFALVKRDARKWPSLLRFSPISGEVENGPRQNPGLRITYFHNEFSRSAKARISFLNGWLTVASGKRTIWRLRSRMEDGNGERKSKSGGIEGMRKSQRVGWACQLVDILNGKLPWPSLQSATTSERQERKQKESLHVYLYRMCFQKFSLLLNHKHQKYN